MKRFLDRTFFCCKKIRIFVVGSEKLIEFRYILFSAKYIIVQHFQLFLGIFFQGIWIKCSFIPFYYLFFNNYKTFKTKNSQTRNVKVFCREENNPDNQLKYKIFTNFLRGFFILFYYTQCIFYIFFIFDRFMYR